MFAKGKHTLGVYGYGYGISMDMYRNYKSIEVVPDVEKTRMANFLSLRYPLYFRIANWLEQTM